MNKLDAARTLYVNNFKSFVKWAWKYVTPYPLVWGKHLDALCDHLQAIRDGKVVNLLVNLPPRHSKSIVCTILFPAWLWLTDPAEAVLSASYATDLADEHSAKSRKLIETGEFRALFPWVVLEDGSNAKDRYKTTAGGGRKAVSVGAGTTGFDATITIIDDLHSIKKKESDAERHNALEYFRNDLSSRAVLGRKSRTVVIGQRVHADDISGLVIDQFRDHPDWSFLVLPMEFDPDRETLPNRIGFTDWRADRGDILFPEAVTPAMVAGFKATARHSYQCLYNQDVMSAAGDTFKAEWFDRKYRLVAVPTDDGRAVYDYHLGDGRVVREAACSRVGTVDIAVSTASTADWTVIVVADLIGADILIRHVHRERLDGTRIVPVVAGVYRGYGPQFLAVEKAGQQGVVIDQLRQAGVPVRAVRPKGDKETRSIPLQIRMESGNVWWPAGADWLPPLVSEFCAFPRGRFDDQVDAVGMVAEMGRYAARAEMSEQERDQADRNARERHYRDMLFAGLE